MFYELSQALLHGSLLGSAIVVDTTIEVLHIYVLIENILRSRVSTG